MQNKTYEFTILTFIDKIRVRKILKPIYHNVSLKYSKITSVTLTQSYNRSNTDINGDTF